MQLRGKRKKGLYIYKPTNLDRTDHYLCMLDSDYIY